MVVPLYDDNPFAAPVKPVVTWCLIAVNLAVFSYEAGASQLALDQMIDTFSLTPAAFTGHMPARGWVPALATIVTYQFFHADIAHLVGNMVFLWVFGDDVERAIGRWRFLAFYLLCGVVGGLHARATSSRVIPRARRTSLIRVIICPKPLICNQVGFSSVLQFCPCGKPHKT